MRFPIFNSLEGRKVLAEHEVKEILGNYGFRMPKRILIAPDEKLGDVGLEYPLVIKASSPEILHKTDIGALKMNIQERKSLEKEFMEMRNKFPDAHILIEEMVRPGVEAIIGVIDDPTFGLAIMVGLGGIYTEIYRDVSFRIIPITKDDAEEMIGDLKAHEVFEGFRGIKTDRKSLIKTLLKVSKLAEDFHENISQMDLNPVFVREKDTVIVDAKMVLK